MVILPSKIRSAPGWQARVSRDHTANCNKYACPSSLALCYCYWIALPAKRGWNQKRKGMEIAQNIYNEIDLRSLIRLLLLGNLPRCQTVNPLDNLLTPWKSLAWAFNHGLRPAFFFFKKWYLSSFSCSLSMLLVTHFFFCSFLYLVYEGVNLFSSFCVSWSLTFVK